MAQLHIPSFPLHGVRLIEASAGTGKTYTISALYLRALLEKEFAVSEILVVTFTEAATEELRERIRRRIHDALLQLEGRSDKPELAEELARWRDDEQAAVRLRDALACMDEAAIFTIHGFCQRTLAENALASGVLFDSEFITDESLLRRQAARDFWRSRVVPAAAARARWVASQWPHPEALLAQAEVLVDNPQVTAEPDAQPGEVAALERQCGERIAELQSLWNTAQQEVTALLKNDKNLGRAKDTYKHESLDAAIAALASALAAGFDAYQPPRGFELFTTDKLQGSVTPARARQGMQAPNHAFFDKAQQLHDVLQRLQRWRRAALLIEAATAIREALERSKLQQRVLFFDDLLNKLAQALDGEGGERLAERMRRGYPLAMIDEFQDTDPVQYRIFRTVYGECRDCGLLMIGDPKQAIYSFRGADIFTYMRAKRNIDASGRYTLGVNWRSHSRLVEGVNRLFARPGRPFIYDADIPFAAVEPAAERGGADASALSIDAAAVTPLLAWLVPRAAAGRTSGVLPNNWSHPRLASACAAEIARLLNLGREGRAKLGDRPLRARDIAVLVRDRYQAEHVRSALRERRVNSITISQESVFASDEARDLSHLLRAVAEPGNAVLLRTALATRLLGWSAQQLHEVDADQQRWESLVSAFEGYRSAWLEQGFMQMFYSLLHRQGVINALQGLPDAERRMTNLLQLAELAQQAARLLPGSEKLLRWLSDERRLAGQNPDEEQQLRLESDEQLVKIVTIHKSKGMEYPVVFLPFIWSSREVKDEGVISFHDEHSHSLHADLGSDRRAGHLQLARRERLAEELRLLYVALTRAQQRCYFCWGHLRGAAESAMAWLLHQRQPAAGAMPEVAMENLTDDGLRAALLSLNHGGGAPCVAVGELPSAVIQFDAAATPEQPPVPLRFSGRVVQSWQLTSFSALSSQTRHDVRIDRPDYDSQQLPAAAPAATLSRFSFPRGARAGECLHGILEQLDFRHAGAAELEEVVQRRLEQAGFDADWRPVVCAWITAVLDTPLDGALTLRAVDSARRFVEMEFHYPLAALHAAALNAILRQAASRGGGVQQSVDFAAVGGFMKGFIDLVFEHRGRYYVVDYKSNHLGDSPDDYRRDALQQAMTAHRYDLQYLIYTLAVHRYLKVRLPGYDYDANFGGVYYLFIRGMDPHHGAERGVYFDRPEKSLVERLDRLFAGEPADD
jgi:exodeoxyribonuclease V beta subunit